MAGINDLLRHMETWVAGQERNREESREGAMEA